MTCTYRGTCIDQPDFLATVDLNPKSSCYGQVPVSALGLYWACTGLGTGCWLCASRCLRTQDFSLFCWGSSDGSTAPWHAGCPFMPRTFLSSCTSLSQRPGLGPSAELSLVLLCRRARAVLLRTAPTRRPTGRPARACLWGCRGRLSASPVRL